MNVQDYYYQLLRKIFSSFIIFFILIFSPHQYSYAAGSVGNCPQPTDTGAFTQVENDGTIDCFSASGALGFNVIGLKKTCGPVICPLQWLYAGLKRGNTCIKKDKNGICHPGSIASGFFDADADPKACQVTDLTTQVPCPTPINLYIKIVDAKGDPVSDATVKINYEDSPPFDIQGKSLDVSSGNGDANGIITVSGKLYSGDHFVIIPQQGNYHFDPPQYGDTTALMKMQMNTTYSCGQSSNNPCTFTVERADTGIASAFAGSTFVIIGIIVLLDSCFDKNGIGTKR